MPFVSHTVEYPGGAVAAGRVSIDLVGENGRPVTDVAYIGDDDDHGIMGDYSADLDNGRWAVNLTGVDDITPSGLRWRVREHVNGKPGTFYLNVPTTLGPHLISVDGDDEFAWFIGDTGLLDVAPASVASSALSAHIATQPIIPNGLHGDGVTDDRERIQDALDEAAEDGGGVVYLPPGTYLIKRTLWLDSKVTLRGAGIGVTTITKPDSVASVLTANASALATSVTVTSSTGFEEDGPIHLYDTTSWEWLSTQGTISDVTGNVITFENAEGLGRTGLDGALQTARTATATTSFPMIRNVEGATRICVRDLTLDHNQNAADPAPTSSTVQAQTDFTLATIHWVEAYYALVENVELLNASGDAYSDQAQDGTGITPAANLIKTTKNTIRGCKIRNATRHAVHLGTCMNGAYVLDNEMTSCGWYGLFYCAYATYSVARGNLMESCGSGFAGIDERDYGNVIANNIIKGSLVYGIDAPSNAGGGGLLTITGNEIFGGVNGCIRVNQPDCTISKNVLDMNDIGNPGISLLTAADRCLVDGNIVTNGGAGSDQIRVDSCDDVRLIGNVFKDGVRGASIRSCLRLVAIGNHMSTMTTAVGWDFNAGTSVDCVIRDERNTLTTPWRIDGAGAVTRLVYEGLGDNATNDPASAGDWNAASGKRFNGTLVRWNSGGGEKVSIFNNGVGWTALN